MRPLTGHLEVCRLSVTMVIICVLAAWAVAATALALVVGRMVRMRDDRSPDEMLTTDPVSMPDLLKRPSGYRPDPAGDPTWQ